MIAATVALALLAVVALGFSVWLAARAAALRDALQVREAALERLRAEQERREQSAQAREDELRRAAEAREGQLRREAEAREEGLRAGLAAALEGRAEAEKARAAAEASIGQERRAAQEKVALVEAQLADRFEALSQKALQASNEQFLQLAEQKFARLQEGAQGDLEKRTQAIHEIVSPVRESLGRVDEKLRELEQVRVGAYASLQEQVKALLETQTALRSETGNLVKALRAPAVRGRWGELQLRRVCEMAGMVEHCDFVQQESAGSDEGRLRPDLVVKLPGGKRLVVDAKVPLAAYLDALECTDEDERRVHLASHARQLRQHVAALSRKAYWEQFSPTPDFVVLFVPNEAVFSAAMQEAPELIETAVNDRVLLASPTTLIAILRGVSMGWRQESLARDAQEIADCGREVHRRLLKFADHFGKVQRGLTTAVSAFNDSVGSYERMVLPSSRRLAGKLALAEDAIEAIPEAAPLPRRLSAPATAAEGAPPGEEAN